MTEHIQQELPLPFPEFSGDLPLLPARMVNEYEYCPPYHTCLPGAAVFRSNPPRLIEASRPDVAPCIQSLIVTNSPLNRLPVPVRFPCGGDDVRHGGAAQ